MNFFNIKNEYCIAHSKNLYTLRAICDSGDGFQNNEHQLLIKQPPDFPPGTIATYIIVWEYKSPTDSCALLRLVAVT